MRQIPANCDRCSAPMTCSTMSWFNTDIICDGCSTKERRHPDYKKAREAECAQTRSGNYNFPGVGLPADL